MPRRLYDCQTISEFPIICPKREIVPFMNYLRLFLQWYYSIARKTGVSAE